MKETVRMCDRRKREMYGQLPSRFIYFFLTRITKSLPSFFFVVLFPLPLTKWKQLCYYYYYFFPTRKTGDGPLTHECSYVYNFIDVRIRTCGVYFLKNKHVHVLDRRAATTNETDSIHRWFSPTHRFHAYITAVKRIAFYRSLIYNFDKIIFEIKNN